MSERQTIGFVGVGNMGLPMSRNLADAGFDVLVFDARAETADAAAAAHDRISVAPDLATIARTCRTVITMLPDSKAVSKVVRGADPAAFGPDGLAAHMDTGAVIVDMSSSFPMETVKLAKDLAARGIKLIDAPVSGGVKKAVTGQLAIMTGGDAADIDGVADMLAAMGKVFRTGACGSGHATKALNNFLSASSLIATAEAIIIGEKFGLDPALLNTVFNASTGRSNTTEVKVAQYFIPRVYNSGFTLALLDKDVGMAKELSNGLGLDMKMLEHVSRRLGEAKAAIDGSVDHTAVHAFLAGEEV